MRTSSGAVSTHKTSHSFALSTFHKLLEQTPDNENLCYSPFGIQLVLSLLHALAAAELREPLLKPFEYGWDSPSENMSALHRIRRVYADEPEIRLLSSLWLRDPQQFTSSARTRFMQEFGCELFNGDFGTSMVREVNGWVNRNTGGRISGVVNDLSFGLLLALNVIHFSGRWMNPFDELLTKLEWFTLGDGTKVRHPRMQLSGSFDYHEDSDCQAVGLYYGSRTLEDSRFSMIVILPKGNDLPSLLRDTSGQAARQDFTLRPGRFECPRFTFQCDPQVTLKMLGLPDSLRLDPGSVGTAFRDEVPIDIKQTVWIRVDEAGTEAAGVTMGTILGSEGGDYKPPEPFRMIVNRPFYFLIIDNYTRTVVFAGRVANPASGL